MRYIILLFSSLIICSSCEKEKESSVEQNLSEDYAGQISAKNEEPQQLYKWVAQDTLLFEYYGSVGSLSYNTKKETYLTRDWFQKKVNEFDKDGKLLHSWDFTGSSPEQIGPEIYGLSYIDESNFVVLGEKGYFFYNSEGSFIRKIDFNDKVSLGSISLTGSIFCYERETQSFIAAQIIANADEYDGTMKEFYEFATLLIEMNLLEEKEYLYAITYPENSIYRDEDNYALSANDAYIEIDERGKAYVLFECEPKVYVYDVHNMYEAKNYIDTQPEYFSNSPILLPYGQAPSFHQSFEAFVAVSKYKDIFTFQDSLMGLVYSQGLPQEFITSQLSLPLYSDSLYQFNKNYFQLFSGSDKLCRDLEFPPGTKIISYIHSLNKIIFLADTRQLDQEPEGDLFYVYSLEKSDKDI